MTAPSHPRLLAALLAALAASGCVEERRYFRSSYTPGTNPGGTHTRSPAGPCAAADDPALPGYLGFFCVEDARVEHGPMESTDARGERVCAYDISARKNQEQACATPGRPLVDGGVARLASLTRGNAWVVVT